MKNWQFIIICILIILWFGVLYYQNKEIVSNQGFYYDLIQYDSNQILNKTNDIYLKVDYIEWMEDAIRGKIYKL